MESTMPVTLFVAFAGAVFAALANQSSPLLDNVAVISNGGHRPFVSLKRGLQSVSFVT
jgi:hypothetical protein